MQSKQAASPNLTCAFLACHLQVFNTRYEFICKEQEAALLQGVTLPELQQFYATHLAPSSAHRRKLTIQVSPTRQAKGKEAGVCAPGVQDAEQQQQQDFAVTAAPHVQHEHGVVEPHSPGRHLVGAAVVHAGGSSSSTPAGQQNGNADALEQDVDAAAAGSPSTRQLSVKRQRRQQQQPPEAAAAAAAAAGSAVDAVALLPPGVQLQLVADPVQFKQGRELYPAYCTVMPQLAGKQ
jgi:hypothetical protein